MNNLIPTLDAFYDELAPESLAPLWTVLRSLVTPEPRTPMAAHRWDYAAVRTLLLRAGELISAEQAERRVLILENPAARGSSAITRTLYAGLQLLLPGEVAPCHRHTQSALRFILEGAGAYTAVDGERAVMQPFDLILTPNGRWHDHGNDTDRAVIWLDGLDIPLVTALDASFSEHLGGSLQHAATHPDGDCRHRFGANLRPAFGRAGAPDPVSPLFHYPYADWREALERVARASAPDPLEAIRMEFINPLSGGGVMPTMSAWCHWAPAGFETAPQRSTDGVIFVVVEGRGRLQTGDRRFDLKPRDVVVAPAWHSRSLAAETDLVLFSYSDRATQEKLGLWRAEAVTPPDA